MRKLAARHALLPATIAVVAFGLPIGSAQASTAGLSGHVWNDANRNGVLDAGEAPMSGIGIQVYNAAGTFVAGASTDSTGLFSFPSLADGTYTVKVPTPTWLSMRDTWTPTTTGSLSFSHTVTLAGSATADLGLRQIVRSTDASAPISTATSASGLHVRSYDDVLTASAVAGAIDKAQLTTGEVPVTTINVDLGSLADTTTGVAGSQGSYSNYTASIWIPFDSWLDNGDEVLFHEYGHAWSLYNAYISQQDSTLTGYLQARGVAGDSRLGSSKAWDPREMIAEDYRQLFGSASAAAYPQANTDIPPASAVPGLKTWMSTTFITPVSGSGGGTSGGSGTTTTTVPAPTVSGISPSSGSLKGGTSVSISGSGFSGSGVTVSAVWFGTVKATSFSVSSSGSISAVSPAGKAAGGVDVTVVTTGGTSATSSADVFTYLRSRK